MAKLRCEAVNCIHNDKPYCCISHICVGGSHADTTSETCCADFRDKKAAAVNGCCDEQKNPVVDIECKAVNCVYNENCHCHADAVDIIGSKANISEETSCHTFKAR